MHIKAAFGFTLGLILAIGTIAPRTSRAQEEPKASGDPSAALETYMRAATEKDGFSGSVLVARAGQPLLRGGYGLANLEHGVPNGPATKFRLGSVTKQFTAMAASILAEQGKLSLDDPIAEHLADTPEAWKEVTVRHLLNHTSGIPNFTDMPDYGPNMPRRQSHEQMLARFRDKPLEFAPGAEFAYSNSGYYLLGMILERVSGTSYEDLLRAKIFEPLGMKDTGYDHPETILPARAAGYERSDSEEGKLVNAPFLDMSQPFSAGALYSTVDDLLIWDQALSAGKLISPAGYAELFQPARDNYAFGWMVVERNGRLEQAHGGGINGFTTIVLRYPKEELYVAVLSNVTPTRVSPMARALAALALGEEPEKPKEREIAAVDPALYDAYVGRYELNPRFIIAVTREGDRLYVQATDQPRLEVFPESEVDFFLKQVDAQVTFVKGPDGAVTHLVLHQGGADQKAKRLAD